MRPLEYKPPVHAAKIRFIYKEDQLSKKTNVQISMGDTLFGKCTFKPLFPLTIIIVDYF